MDKNKNLFLIVAIIFAAILMRSPITGVSPLIGSIKVNLGLSNTMAGFITTIPLIAFAVVSPFVSKLNNKFGTGRLMLCAIFVLSIGILVRSYTGTTGFFAGTIIIGLGISIINVMIPSISRAYFPSEFGLVTSLYVTVMSVFAGISSGISVPLAENIGLGWRNALAIWLILPMASILVWYPIRKLQIERKVIGQTQAQEPEQKNIYKSPIAWWLSIYTGIQSLLFYCLVAWLPTMLQAKGISTQAAGYYVSAYLLIGISASFLIPLIAVRKNNQKLLVSVLSFFYVFAMCIFFKATNSSLLLGSVLLCGFCGAAGVSLSMLFIGLRSKGPQEAAKLSGMSQSLGYGLSAFGPFVMGRLFDITGSWSIPTICLIIVIFILIFIGFKAGENRTV